MRLNAGIEHFERIVRLRDQCRLAGGGPHVVGQILQHLPHALGIFGAGGDVVHLRGIVLQVVEADRAAGKRQSRVIAVGPAPLAALEDEFPVVVPDGRLFVGSVLDEHLAAMRLCFSFE